MSFWEANRFSVSTNFLHFMEPGSSLPHLQTSPTCPYPKQEKSSLSTHPTSWRSILILSHPFVGLPSGLLHLGLPTKSLYVSLQYPICATCPPLSFILILSPEWRMKRRTEHTVPHLPNPKTDRKPRLINPVIICSTQKGDRNLHWLIIFLFVCFSLAWLADIYHKCYTSPSSTSGQVQWPLSS